MKTERTDQSMRAAVAHHQAGRLSQAETIYRQILAEYPNHPEALHLLGLIASSTARGEDAVELIRRAIDINPANPLFRSNLGVVLRNGGRLDEAIVAFNGALQIRPDYPEAWNHLGNALRDGGRQHEAISAYRKALQVTPRFAQAWSNLGSVLRDVGELDEAIDAFREALRLQPGYASAWRNLGNSLNDRGNLDEAIQCLRRAVTLAPDHPAIHSSLVFALSHHPDFDEAAVASELQEWAKRHASSMTAAVSFQNDALPDRRLKVAYLSRYFCDSAEFHYLLPMLANHDHEQFEVHLFPEQVREDEFTALARRYADHWHSIVGLSDAAVAGLMQEHRIDIAVLIGHHSPGSRLLVMARKPAPVQLTWLFSAASTGLMAIDYRVSDAHIDPPGVDDSLYSERTLRLPETPWCYDPLVEGLDPQPTPALQRGFVTFGCLNRIWKINDVVAAHWSRVLRAVPNSRLCLLAPQGGVRRRVLELFESFQIGSSRIDFVTRQARKEYLQNYNRIDIVLDTFPYNGHTTSLDALWMGVPVVTLKHRRPVGRVGVSLLRNVGLADLISESPDEFVATATHLAADLLRLTALRASLRQRIQSSPLMRASEFAHNMEAAYRRAWQEWCKTQVANQLPM